MGSFKMVFFMRCFEYLPVTAFYEIYAKESIIIESCLPPYYFAKAFWRSEMTVMEEVKM